MERLYVCHCLLWFLVSVFKDFNVEVSCLGSVHRCLGFLLLFVFGGHCEWDCYPDFFLSMIIITEKLLGFVVDFVPCSSAEGLSTSSGSSKVLSTG